MQRQQIKHLSACNILQHLDEVRRHKAVFFPKKSEAKNKKVSEGKIANNLRNCHSRFRIK